MNFVTRSFPNTTPVSPTGGVLSAAEAGEVRPGTGTGVAADAVGADRGAAEVPPGFGDGTVLAWLGSGTGGVAVWLGAFVLLRRTLSFSSSSAFAVASSTLPVTGSPCRIW